MSQMELAAQSSLAEIAQGDGLVITRDPEMVLEEAHRAAAALTRVISAKPDKIMFGPKGKEKQYLCFEDWQCVGRFYGIAPRIVSDRYVEYGAATGWEATAEAVHVPSGRVVSSANAMCLDDEEKWSARPKYAWVYHKRSGGTSEADPGKDELIWEKGADGKSRPKKERMLVGEEKVPAFQLRSMAQTRAGAKALRNALAWVVVLAGYEPTPAEELTQATVVEQAVVDETTGEVLDGPPADHQDDDERAALMTKIRASGDVLGLKANERATLWAKHVGANVHPNDADIAQLADLYDHLNLMRKKEKK